MSELSQLVNTRHLRVWISSNGGVEQEDSWLMAVVSNIFYFLCAKSHVSLDERVEVDESNRPANRTNKKDKHTH